MSDDLVAFLLARIAEDEQAAQAMFNAALPEQSLSIHDRPLHTWISEHPSQETWEMVRRVLAECEAKRRIVEECQDVMKYHFSDDFAADDLAEKVLKLLALSYAAHPDYRPEWALQETR